MKPITAMLPDAPARSLVGSLEPTSPTVSAAGAPAYPARLRTIRRRPLRPGWRGWFRWPVVVGMAGLAWVLLGWSLIWRWPMAAEWPALAATAPAGPVINDQDWARSLARETAVRNRLLKDRADWQRLLTALEADLLERGWKAEMEIRPPIASPGGFTDLVAYPVMVTWSVSGRDSAGDFAQVLDWVEGLARQPHPVQVVQWSLAGATEGLSSVRVELHYYGASPHENPGP